MATLPMRLFCGFPYLSTRVVPRMYHVILLPADLAAERLVELAAAQVLANRLEACLVLARDRAIRFDADGTRADGWIPPCGAAIVTGMLAPVFEFADSDELRVRRERLGAFLTTAGYTLADPTKCGRPATEHEQARLAGVQHDGTPRGLERCAQCQGWHGVCLGQSDHFKGQLRTVHCDCDNHNSCARCGRLLFTRRLNANFYDAKARTIFHAPGFCGLDHRCAVHDLTGRMV